MKDELEALINQMVENGIPYTDALREFERPLIKIILDCNQGNQSKAAKALGIHRNTLSRKIKELGIGPAPDYRKRRSLGRRFKISSTRGRSLLPKRAPGRLGA